MNGVWNSECNKYSDVVQLEVTMDDLFSIEKSILLSKDSPNHQIIDAGYNGQYGHMYKEFKTNVGFY